MRVKTTSTALAVIISLAFLALSIPHSAEVWSQFEKPGSWLPWFSAVGLEVLVAYAMFVVCERGYEVWVKVVAGVLVTIAIAASFILNFAHYLSINSNGWYAAGLAALLPGLVALLGAMLPGLMADKPMETLAITTPPVAPQVDPMPMLHEFLEGMRRQMAEDSATSRRELATAVANLPELVARTVATQLPEREAIPLELGDGSSFREVVRELREIGEKNKDIAAKLREMDATNDEIASALSVSVRSVQNYFAK